ncbi:Uncharacterised protein [uncultured archaeon]|nr:Uncharacterised protein [uncultured archaeon]
MTAGNALAASPKRGREDSKVALVDSKSRLLYAGGRDIPARDSAAARKFFNEINNVDEPKLLEASRAALAKVAARVIADGISPDGRKNRRALNYCEDLSPYRCEKSIEKKALVLRLEGTINSESLKAAEGSDNEAREGRNRLDKLHSMVVALEEPHAMLYLATAFKSIGGEYTGKGENLFAEARDRGSEFANIEIQRDK